MSKGYWFIGLVLAAGAARAQTEPMRTSPERGFHPNGTYAVSEMESINVTNGNLVYRIPIASLPAGRAGMAAGVSLVYNSALYDIRLDYSQQPHLTHNLSLSERGG
jgi:hypothetical protein